MKTISKSAQGPCALGAPAVRRLGSGLVCARCLELERKWSAEVNRQEAGRHRRDMNCPCRRPDHGWTYTPNPNGPNLPPE